MKKSPSITSKNSDLALVLSTIDSKENAQRMAQAIVEKGLAACVNILPGLRSIYRWQGKLEDQGEHLLLMKTNMKNYSALEKAIKQLHPYEVPEIIACKVSDAHPAYRRWVLQALGDQSPKIKKPPL